MVRSMDLMGLKMHATIYVCIFCYLPVICIAIHLSSASLVPRPHPRNEANLQASPNE